MLCLFASKIESGFNSPSFLPIPHPQWPKNPHKNYGQNSEPQKNCAKNDRKSDRMTESKRIVKSCHFQTKVLRIKSPFSLLYIRISNLWKRLIVMSNLVTCLFGVAKPTKNEKMSFWYLKLRRKSVENKCSWEP